MNDSLTLRGDVRFSSVMLDGTTSIWEEKNLIVTTGKTVVAKLLGGDAAYASLNEINQIGFGTSGITPVVGDTALTGVVYKTATVSYPAANQVKFTATLPAAEGNAILWKELGLVTKTNTYLFSRVLIANGTGITKTADMKFIVEWTISVT